jgi:hypothetical protein
MDSKLFPDHEGEYETVDSREESEIYRPPSAASMYYMVSRSHVWKVPIIGNRFHCLKFELADQRSDFVISLVKGSEHEIPTVKEWLSVAEKVI